LHYTTVTATATVETLFSIYDDNGNSCDSLSDTLWSTYMIRQQQKQLGLSLRAIHIHATATMVAAASLFASNPHTHYSNGNDSCVSLCGQSTYTLQQWQ